MADWYSINEVAAELGCTDRTVHRLVNDGALVCYRIGRVFRVKAEDLDAYLESARVRPGELEHLVPKYHGPRRLEAAS